MITGALFVGGLLLLYAGGEGLVYGAAALGVRFGMTPLVAGLTIVAFATSAPELAVCLRTLNDGAQQTIAVHALIVSDQGSMP